MEAVLKEHCVPVLRGQGFKGSFPNFYRDTDGFVSLINFQFWSSGGSFCVNLSFADPQRKNVAFQHNADVKKLRVSQTRAQCRLGAVNGGDHWFSFGKTSYAEFRGEPTSMKENALACNRLLLTEAETWWQAERET
ncbi:DUF4304 domain-containing protein [Rhodobacteraceae bacterium]|nr:DUF4304 domain-containing protein [Paracoccaceae bacterium]